MKSSKKRQVVIAGAGLIGSTMALALASRGFDVTLFDGDEEVQTSVGGGIALRGSFLIDEDGVVRHSVINDLPLGRNIDEMLRMIDALSHNQKHGEVCPAGWQEGEDAMAESPEGVSSYLTDKADTL